MDRLILQMSVILRAVLHCGRTTTTRQRCFSSTASWRPPTVPTLGAIGRTTRRGGGKLHSLWRAGAHLMGGVTYRDMAAVWPGSDSDYAAPMGELHVEIARLKDEPGNDLLAHGGATFAQALTRSGRRHVRASAHAVWPGRRIPPDDPPGGARNRSRAVRGPTCTPPSRPGRGQDLRDRGRRPRLPSPPTRSAVALRAKVGRLT